LGCPIAQKEEAQMTMFGRIAGIVCLAGVAYLSLNAEPASVGAAAENMSESDFELMRSDIRTKKAAMIAERMKFTDQEAAGFWPVYRQYETDFAAINDKKVSIMKEYISRHQSLNDTQAKQLAEDVFDVDQKTLPPKTIVRWLQLERRLQLLVDAQLAKDLPGIER
jgi:hypothetical protein